MNKKVNKSNELTAYSACFNSQILNPQFRKIILAAMVLLFSYSAEAQVSGILGEWKTVDDKSGEIRSLVRIYQDTADGLYYGKIEKLYEYADAVCDKCEGENKNKPILGMVIITGMKAEGDALKRGTILDPENGKKYYASISIDRKTEKLVIRGSLDKRGLFGRNQYWIK
ncbi:MAG: DUF2147 domain-containing protein [Prevotellaceae bacterium]|jgi:uncharacterized protein (DUF2147 family)|nr:DUF2147 domain-containing protein [Prevotellaceae bacterium]